MIYNRDYYVSVNDEQVIITKKAVAPFNVMSPSDRYLYKVGDKSLNSIWNTDYQNHYEAL